nr:hypothetical protein Iba_chr12bCG17810 [Ipomoea batatas]
MYGHNSLYEWLVWIKEPGISPDVDPRANSNPPGTVFFDNTPCFQYAAPYKGWITTKFCIKERSILEIENDTLWKKAKNVAEGLSFHCDTSLQASLCRAEHILAILNEQGTKTNSDGDLLGKRRRRRDERSKRQRCRNYERRRWREASNKSLVTSNRSMVTSNIKK